MWFSTRFLVASILLLVLPLAGGAQEVEETPLYRIDSGDRLLIRCLELPDVDGDYVVEEDGTVELPHAGTTIARGQSETELARRIERELLLQGLRQATVTVAVREARAQPLTVIGAVGIPGHISLREPEPLFDVLLRAGGLAEQNGGTVVIRRQAPNGLVDEIEIAVEDLIGRGDPIVNLPVQAGDRINVPFARKLTYYFLGEVENKGMQSVEGTEGVTLLVAIAQAGGLSENASSKIRILREKSDGSRFEINVDYRRILAGKDPDVALQHQDIIVVKEAFF